MSQKTDSKFGEGEDQTSTDQNKVKEEQSNPDNSGTEKEQMMSPEADKGGNININKTVKSRHKRSEAGKKPKKLTTATKNHGAIYSKRDHERNEEEEEEKNEAPRESHDKSIKKGNETERSSDTSNRRHKQTEFFKQELQRLETSLKTVSSKIQAPRRKAYTPYIFNTLEPYCNTHTTRFLIELPEEMQHGYASRRTAQGLTDPWLDLWMDRDIPKIKLSCPVNRQIALLKKDKKIQERKNRSVVAHSRHSQKEGSTHLPKFPIVFLETPDLATKQLNYSDVPVLRHELKTKYSASAQSKISEDYKRTQQDFYRMELHKLEEVHPINRRNLKSTYFAYLQNNPGSKKAVTECMHNLKLGKV